MLVLLKSAVRIPDAGWRAVPTAAVLAILAYHCVVNGPAGLLSAAICHVCSRSAESTCSSVWQDRGTQASQASAGTKRLIASIAMQGAQQQHL